MAFTIIGAFSAHVPLKYGNFCACVWVKIKIRCYL
nr:MAG TPA: hypothetical protein [Caudoviricetes sp.]